MFPKPISEKRLEEIKEAEAEKLKRYNEVGYDPDEAGPQMSLAMKRNRQERFLEVFRRCLSPSMAASQSDVSMRTYYKWRGSDSHFAEQLNTIMDEWESEAQSSIATRIVGYTQLDPETGQVQVDADGKIIRHGASDALARQYVDHKQRARAAEHVNGPPVINLVALGVDPSRAIETAKQMSLKHEHIVVEGDFADVTPDPAP